MSEYKNLVVAIPDGGDADAVVPGAGVYTKFIMQLVGVTNGTGLSVHISLDGSTYAPLEDPLISNAADNTGVGKFELPAPTKGIKVVTDGNGANGAKVIVSMNGNVTARRSYTRQG